MTSPGEAEREDYSAAWPLVTIRLNHHWFWTAASVRRLLDDCLVQAIDERRTGIIQEGG